FPPPPAVTGTPGSTPFAGAGQPGTAAPWATARSAAPPLPTAPPPVPAPALPAWPASAGTDGPGFATVSFPQGNPLENSGSLTGHILAQGWAEDGPATRSSNTRVVIVLAAALALLVSISLLVVFLANDALSGITGTVLTR
ncbi:hypothetical protein ACW0Q9_13390, partial [Micromonospora sp. I033]